MLLKLIQTSLASKKKRTDWGNSQRQLMLNISTAFEFEVMYRLRSAVKKKNALRT